MWPARHIDLMDGIHPYLALSASDVNAVPQKLYVNLLTEEKKRGSSFMLLNFHGQIQKSRPVMRRKSLTVWSLSPWLKYLTLFFLFHFKGMFILFILQYYHMKMSSQSIFSSKIIFETFYYILHQKERRIWHMGCGTI